MKTSIKSGYKEGLFSGGVKSLDDQSRIVSGYFASFGTLDSDQDVILEGAFSKSLKERGVGSTSNRQIKFLHQHNVLEPIGSFKELREDSVGLYFEAQIEKTPLGDVVLERYSNGSYKEHSIGFKYIADSCQWGDFTKSDGAKTEAFLCSELNLFEGSVVTFGANENTPFLGFKGSQEDLIKQIESEEAFLIKNCKNYEQEITLRQIFSRQKSLVSQLADTKSLIKGGQADRQEETSQKNKNDEESNLVKLYQNLIV